MPLTPGSRLGPYEVLSPLGAGGMGEVYRARDPRLGRDVALKIVTAGGKGRADRLRRFEKEARAVAALNDPHVVAVHDVGSEGGVAYIIFELLKGQTLRDRLADGPIAPRKAVEYGVQIGRGLAAAHARGLVHRDLKPENLFLTSDGRIKILDFGLARLSELRDGDVKAAVTQTATDVGVVVGTSGYMSPEQARGKRADARSDIFALGAVLYEMLSGKPAFAGDSAADRLSAILNYDPAELTVAGHEPVSSGLERVVRRCLEKDPKERFQTARDVAFALEAVGDPSGLPSATAGSAKRRALRTKPAPIRSLAVLPLRNLSGDREQDYFTDGMTEALITELAKVAALRVTSRTSVMAYKQAGKSLPVIARELDVDAIVEGSVIRSGERVRITAQLIRGAEDRHLWAEAYERELRDVLSLQREVALAIAREVRVNVTPAERARLAEARSIDPVANEAYLKGRYYFNEGINRPRPGQFRKFLEKSVVSYHAAIKRAPEYAPAHAALAQAYHWLATWVAPEQFAKAKEAAQRALELDETLAQAHAALAFTINWMDWDWPGAETHYRRAIELNPSLGNEGHHGYAILLSAAGRHEEAIAEIERAEQLDPVTLTIKENAGAISLYARQYKRAIGKFRRLLELEPNSPFVHFALAQAYVLKGMCDDGVSEAQTAVRLAPGTLFPEATLAWAFARCGQREEAFRILRMLEPAKRDDLSVALACINTALGMRDAALTWLERAYRRRLMWLPWFFGDPRLDPIRGDPRFLRVAEAIGIPQAGEIRA